MANQPVRDMDDADERMPQSGRRHAQVPMSSCATGKCGTKVTKTSSNIESKKVEKPINKETEYLYAVPYVSEGVGFQALTFKTLEEAQKFSGTVKNGNSPLGAIIYIPVSKIRDENGVSSKVKWF